MEPLPKKRPTSITVIGWIFIVIAILNIMSRLVGILFLPTHQKLMDITLAVFENTSERELPVFIKFFFKNTLLLTLISLAISVLMLIAGIYFLKLRSWARRVLEIITWMIMFSLVAYSIFWMPFWISTMDFKTSFVVIPMVIFGIFAVIFWICLPLLVIKHLRGKTIREAIAFCVTPE